MKGWWIVASLLLGFSLALSLYVMSQTEGRGRVPPASAARDGTAVESLAVIEPPSVLEQSDTRRSAPAIDASGGLLTTLELRVEGGGLRSPAYTVRVSGDGNASFVGNRWCVFEGTTEWVITEPALRAISEAIRAADLPLPTGTFDDFNSATSFVNVRATLDGIDREIHFRWIGDGEPAEVRAARRLIQVVLDNTDTRPLISPRLVTR